METDGQKLERINNCIRVSYRIVDTVLLFIVILLQGFALSYYLVVFHDGSSQWYFFFLSDFITDLMFLCGSIFAIKFYRKNPENENVNSRAFFSTKFPRKFGTLPMVWICWTVYVALLSVKIFILHNEQIAQQLSQQLEPHTIKLCISMASIVFLLWVEIHKSPEANDKAKYLVTSVLFEIFDSITLLDLLMPQQNGVTQTVSTILLVLVGLNLLLPVTGLFRLTKTDSRGGNDLYHHFARIFLINVPYIVIRVYLWLTANQEISIFLLKNVLSIFIGIREIIPQILPKKSDSQRRRNSDANPLSVVFDNNKKRDDQ